MHIPEEFCVGPEKGHRARAKVLYQVQSSRMGRSNLSTLPLCSTDIWRLLPTATQACLHSGLCQPRSRIHSSGPRKPTLRMHAAMHAAVPCVSQACPHFRHRAMFASSIRRLRCVPVNCERHNDRDFHRYLTRQDGRYRPDGFEFAQSP